MPRLLLLLGIAAIAVPTTASAERGEFRFGGYGRVNVSTDGDGGRGRSSQIVPWGPRITKPGYIELDFAYGAWRAPDAKVDTVVTLALEDAFFHYTGQWESAIAVRQAYAEAYDLLIEGGFVWVGSRMVRGDDIYLLDFWPMDILNTMGAGLGWRGPREELSLHAGFNRLENAYQTQRVSVPDGEIGSADILLLDRQRTIVSAKAEQRFGGADGALGMKLRLYSELHHLPSGEMALPPKYTDRWPLPDDRGWLLGAQFGMWNFARNGHLNVWLRYARGIAVNGEFGQPTGLDQDRRGIDESELRLAFAANYETSKLGVLAGGYLRTFSDGDANEEDFDDRVESAFSVRPTLFYGRYFTPAVEASIQLSRPNGLNPRNQQQETATITQIALIPAISFGPAPVGSYSRPQLNLIYAISFLNNAALAYYPDEDPRSAEATVHFVGIGAEWWFGRGGGY